jgi:hypothetical protein
MWIQCKNAPSGASAVHFKKAEALSVYRILASSSLTQIASSASAELGLCATSQHVAPALPSNGAQK